jgi:hypothetical protein
MHGLGVYAKAHIVEENTPIGTCVVDQDLLTILQPIQRSERIIPIQSEIESEVVAGSDRDTEEGNIAFNGNPSDESKRAIASGHADGIRASVYRITCELDEIVTSLQHDGLDSCALRHVD